jgi:hypothetical protein
MRAGGFGSWAEMGLARQIRYVGYARYVRYEERVVTVVV